MTLARKQAVERYKRTVKKGAEKIDFAKLIDDDTSPTDSYIASGNMEDDLAEFPDRLYDHHVSIKFYILFYSSLLYYFDH
jgi:hypothetical protein